MTYNRTIKIYALATVVVFLFNLIYSQFARGVSSFWMDYAYLYVLIMGLVFFVVLKYTLPQLEGAPGFRLFYNLYHTGVAVLVNGMLLLGIMEIAGGSSTYVSWFFYIGVGFLLLSWVVLVKSVVKSKTID